MTLSELAAACAKEILTAEPDNPYNVLARLPISLYVTSNLDPFLEVALGLAQENKHRITEPSIDKIHVANFTRIDTLKHATLLSDAGASDAQTTFAVDSLDLPNDKFTAQNPTVLQLFGNYASLNKAVIAEDDYFEFMLGFFERIRDSNPILRGKLTRSDFAFLGFKWNSLEFRTLFRVLRRYAEMQRAEAFHIAVQIDPDDDETLHPQKALEYLRQYFRGDTTYQSARVSIYWGSTDDFLNDLEALHLDPSSIYQTAS